MFRRNRNNFMFLVSIFCWIIFTWTYFYVRDWKSAFHSLHVCELNEQKSQEGTIKISSNYSSRESSEHYTLTKDYANQVSMEGAPFKRILFWNEAYGSKDYDVGLGRWALTKLGCPVSQCETSDDRRDVTKYDAIVFHLRSWTPTDLPEERSAHQRYVFWNVESAAWKQYHVSTDRMKHFFNWTMTYRWDSDIVKSYGWIEPNNGVDEVPFHPNPEEMKRYLDKPSPVNYAEGKTKMAAWFVSSCTSMSGRSELVDALKKYIEVDVYGQCGTMECSRKDEDYCRLKAGKKYKFYMSLENTLCLDYVTEKFYFMMKHPIIPIVIDIHENHKRMAPPHSYINAADFKDVKELADYLILLDKNDTLYNQYFWWKPYFHVRNTVWDSTRAMCHLCAKLHDKSLPTKVYHDMTNWWHEQASCKTIQFKDLYSYKTV